MQVVTLSVSHMHTQCTSRSSCENEGMGKLTLLLSLIGCPFSVQCVNVPHLLGVVNMWVWSMQEMVGEVLENVSDLSSAPRPVLQLLKRKPKSIKFYEPSYDEV